MPAIRTCRGFAVRKLVLLGLQGCVTTTAASRFSWPLLPFFPGERHLSPAASLLSLARPSLLCSVSPRPVLVSGLYGRRGTQLPTQQTVNLRPPPPVPGSHLLFGPLATCRGHRSGRLLTLLVLTAALTPPCSAISGCPLMTKTRGYSVTGSLPQVLVCLCSADRHVYGITH